MQLIRSYEPTFDRLRAFDRFFDEAFGRVGNRSANSPAVPSADFSEDDHAVYARLEVPGVDKEDVQLRIEQNVLRFSAKREEKDAEGKVTRRWSYARQFTLPRDTNNEAIRAQLDNGVLTLTLPKSEAAKPRQISVE